MKKEFIHAFIKFDFYPFDKRCGDRGKLKNGKYVEERWVSASIQVGKKSKEIASFSVLVEKKTNKVVCFHAQHGGQGEIPERLAEFLRGRVINYYVK